jgi:chromate transporter
MTPDNRFFELAPLFLQLGTISFGGPAAHIAFMQTEVVKRRQWAHRPGVRRFARLRSLIPAQTPPSLRLAWVETSQTHCGNR